MKCELWIDMFGTLFNFLGEFVLFVITKNLQEEAGKTWIWLKLGNRVKKSVFQA